MNLSMEEQFRRHMLRRDWKSAVQILKAALEIDAGDATATNQLADQHNRFLVSANELLKEARFRLANGDHAAVEEIAQIFDTDFPEWTVLADSDETLWTLWNATRGKSFTTHELINVESSEQPLGDTINREGLLRKLLDKTQPESISTLTIGDLRALEQELAEAQRAFDPGSSQPGISQRELSEALTTVRSRIRDRASNSIPRRTAVGLLSLGTLIAGTAIWWLMIHSGQMKDYIRFLVECAKYLPRSTGNPSLPFVVIVGSLLAASSYWTLSIAPRLWNRSFQLRDVHHIMFGAAAIITFLLAIMYAGVEYMQPVAQREIETWRSELITDWHKDVPTRTHDVHDALQVFEQRHPFLGLRLLSRGDRLKEDLSTFIKTDPNPTADPTEQVVGLASRYLESQAKIVLAGIQSNTQIVMWVFFIGVQSLVFTVISIVAYRSLKSR